MLTKTLSMSEDSSDLSKNLEEEALKRKERLKRFQKKKQNTESTIQDTEVLPRPKFRSYKPQDEELQSNVISDVKPVQIEDEVTDLLAAANEKVVIDEIDISTLAPRKPDWDLKRDVAKKLERLERRTQKAIAELIWERLKTGESDNLGAIVNMSDSKGMVDEE